MSTIDLILLGSLCQSPKSAYDLQKQIEARHLSRWVKIGSYTVYKKVTQYETKGLVTGKIEKHGNMPEKKVYRLTSAGKQKFEELMTDFSQAETRIFLDFNAVIVNLALLSENSAAACLANIKDSIHRTRQQLCEQLPRKQEITTLGQSILEQQLMLLETLAKWEESFEKLLEERRD